MVFFLRDYVDYHWMISVTVQVREKSLKAMENEVHHLRISTDNKVDKYV